MFADLPLPRRYAYAALATALCAFALTALVPLPRDLAGFLLRRQDQWLLLAQALVLLVIGRNLGDWRKPLTLPPYGLLVAAILIAAFCYAGHLWVLCGYDFSRDEQMAVFDAHIFAAGLRAQPLPEFWQAHASALNTLFMLPVEHPIAWVSGYLPMNAFMRTIVGVIFDPALTGPLLTGIGGVALFKCARTLWPDDREAAVLALLLYVTSGQVLLAGMTAFAMPGHLTLDLIWLWLFLQRRYGADLAALLVGFVATGLHQPLFHPLFVAPFLALLLRERAWGRVGLYAAGYAVICGFWLAWPGWVHSVVAGPNSVTALGTGDWSRLKLILAATGNPRWLDMSANLLRFVAWQNMLLLPLMVAGVTLAWRKRTVAALSVGIVLPIGIMAIIMPFQGHGFGYRYLHSVIGSAILLAVYGWRHLAAEHGWLRSLFVRSVILSLLVLLPLQLWMAHNIYIAFASVDKHISTSGVDYFAIGRADTSFAEDLVINRADLSNKPIRLFAEELSPPLMAHICASKPRIALPTSRFFSPIDAYFAAPTDRAPDERITRLTPKLEGEGCKVVIVDDPSSNRP